MIEEFSLLNHYILSGDLLAGRITMITKPDLTIEVEKSYYHLDHLNSTKCVTDETGVLVVMYEYRAFGEQLKRLDAAGDDTDDSAKYSYGGKELDDGTNLYYFNARYYDATIGRFINVDPMQDGSNWYVYCGNNPLCFADPTGLRGGEAWKKSNQLYHLREIHQIDKLGTSAQQKFNHYFYTMENVFEQKGDCIAFAKTAGSEFAKVMNEILGSKGSNVAEQVANYLKGNTEVQEISANKAMEFTNQGRDVLVVGRYYVDNPLYQGFTRHFAITAPSLTAIEGGQYEQKYLGVKESQNLGGKDPNGFFYPGMLVANNGYANGFTSLSYAYNSTQISGIQETEHGTEALVFLLLPENNKEDTK